MKNWMKLMTLLALSLTFSHGAMARLPKNPLLIKKIPVETVKSSTKALGLETYEGRKIALSAVKKKWFTKKTLHEVLKRDQIELKNGEIIYPEEVEFGLALKKYMANRASNPYGRAPKDDEE